MKQTQKNNRKSKKVVPVVSNTYPMRINKYLAHKGTATRVGVDELIKSKKVFINGKTAVLGDKVMETDKVEVRGVHNKKKFVYLAYNKPRGIVSTNAEGNDKDIMKSISLKNKDGIFPVGRIDKESSGLMILTNDGRVTDRLLNPIYQHEKEYIVEVDRRFTPGFIKNMQEGVDIGECITKPAKVNKIDDTTFNIVLTEGKNRQIRRMTEKLGYTVRNLERIRVQNIELEKMPANSYREINGDELSQFLNSIGLGN
ncbi:MAG: pseudouridine synthase [Parcubacteria group bacterium]